MAETAFELIGANVILAVSLTVIDTVNPPASMRVIPIRGFIGMHRGHTVNVFDCQFNVVPATVNHERQCTALALAEGRHDAALACLLLNGQGQRMIRHLERRTFQQIICSVFEL